MAGTIGPRRGTGRGADRCAHPLCRICCGLLAAVAMTVEDAEEGSRCIGAQRHHAAGRVLVGLDVVAAGVAPHGGGGPPELETEVLELVGSIRQNGPAACTPPAEVSEGSQQAIESTGGESPSSSDGVELSDSFAV